MDKLRGHNIEIRNGEWCYSDNGESTAKTWKSRPCGFCGKHDTEEGHDGCLGYIPNLMNACCGHGSTKDVYIQNMDGSTLRGIDALNKIAEINLFKYLE